MAQYKAFFILFAVLCGYAFCQQSVTISPTADTTATISKGGELIVKIKGNPTTGYGWYLSNADQLKSVVQATNLNAMGSSTNYVQDPAPAGFMGVGGTYLFRFNALTAADNVNLNFVYRRSWENTPIRELTVALKITE